MNDELVGKVGDVISDGVGNDYSSISIARAAIAAYEQHLADTGMVTVRMGVREMHDDIVKAVLQTNQMMKLVQGKE
jgi:hypothetical protein